MQVRISRSADRTASSSSHITSRRRRIPCGSCCSYGCSLHRVRWGIGAKNGRGNTGAKNVPCQQGFPLGRQYRMRWRRWLGPPRSGASTSGPCCCWPWLLVCVDNFLVMIGEVMRLFRQDSKESMMSSSGCRAPDDFISALFARCLRRGWTLDTHVNSDVIASDAPRVCPTLLGLW